MTGRNVLIYCLIRGFYGLPDYTEYDRVSIQDWV